MTFNYVVLGGIAYEGQWLEGVFSTLDNAIKHVELKITPRGYTDHVDDMYITKIEVDNPKNQEEIDFTEEYVLYCDNCKEKLVTGVGSNEATDFFDFHRDQKRHGVNWLEYTGKIILDDHQHVL